MALAVPDIATVVNTLTGAIVGRQALCDGLKALLITAGWSATFYKKGTDLCSNSGVNPLAGDTVTLAGQVYTFRAVLAAPNDVLIGADVVESWRNLMNAVNTGPGVGVAYATGTVVNASVTAGPVWLSPVISLSIQTKSALEWLAPVLTVSEAFTDPDNVFTRLNLEIGGWICDTAIDPDGNSLRLYILNALELSAVQQIRVFTGNQEMTCRSTTLAPLAAPNTNNFGVRLDASTPNPWRFIANQYGMFFFWDTVAAAALTAFNMCGFGIVQIDSTQTGIPIIGIANNGGFVQIAVSADPGWANNDGVCIRGVPGWSFGDNLNTQTIIQRDDATHYTTDLPYIGPYSVAGRAGKYAGTGIRTLVDASWGVFGNGSDTWIFGRLSSNPGGTWFQSVNGFCFLSAITTGGLGQIGMQTVGPARKTDNEPGLMYSGPSLGCEPGAWANNSPAAANACYLGLFYGMFINIQATAIYSAGTFDAYNWLSLTDNNGGSGTHQQGTVFVLVP